MAIYQHRVTGDRVRPALGERGKPGVYEAMLRASADYELVDAEDGPEESPAPVRQASPRRNVRVVEDHPAEEAK